MSDKCLRVAVVGCGVISELHIAAILAVPSIRICALVDTVPEKANSRLSEFSLDARVYEDYVEMLDKEHPDAVHICTPHYLHCPMAIEALERGVHVFLEKPMGISNEQIDAVLAAEKKSAASLAVCFQNRFNPSTLMAKELADADGGVLHAYASLFWWRGVPYYRESGWRGKKATEGGGVMINQAIHTIDLLCFFLGKPRKVCATTANHHLKGIIDVEDTAEGVITFESGRRANFYATTAFEGQDGVTLVLKTKNHKIEIRTPRLYLDGEPYELPEGAFKYRGKECYGNGHKHLIGAFYAALRDGGDMPVPAPSATDALRVILAAYRSCDREIEV